MVLKSRFLTLFGIGTILCSFSAFAYLDPGSGSVLLQILIGALATTALILKTRWTKIKAFFSKKNESKEN